MTRRRIAFPWMGPLAAVVLAIAAGAGAPGAHSAVPVQLTDTAIAEALEDQLFIDQAVPAQTIDTRVEKGIAELSGRVGNILAKERAGRIAESVKGVRAVVNTIRVEPARDRKPIEIEQDVINALAVDPVTESWEVFAKVDKGGVVTLTGTVESWREREFAGQVAKGVAGVTDVTNEIAVEPAEDRPDRQIATEIEKALRWDTLIDDAMIDVAVEDGKVTLSGVVGSAAERRRARMKAWTAGVEAVDDRDLVVARWTRDPALREDKYVVKSDDAIRDAVRDALELDPRVTGESVETSVMAGIVTLRGRVASLQAKRAAADVARNTVGVVDVVNRLAVRPEQPLADDALEGRVGAALLRDPYVERFEVDVTVIGGTAYLGGTVDTYFEKARADTVASGVDGIVHVVNNLDVRRTDAPLTYDPYREDPYTYDFDWYVYEPSRRMQTDEAIKQAIESELWWSPFVDSDDITVSVDGGVAILEGTVESWSEYSAARENAFEGGATWVDNDLSVVNPDQDS